VKVQSEQTWADCFTPAKQQWEMYSCPGLIIDADSTMKILHIFWYDKSSLFVKCFFCCFVCQRRKWARL